MSFGGFGNSNAAPSGGFGGFGSSGTSGGFGNSAAASPFGGGATTGGFGAGASTFGAGAAKPAFGGFGTAAPSTGGAFGAQQTNTTGFGGFGAATTPSTGFGTGANPTTTSGFPASSAFGGGVNSGGFGSTGTSAFGASTPFGAKPVASSSPFGATSAFGGTAGTTSAFGGGATTGGFGTPSSASSGMFGSTTGGFGASAAKSPFGGPSVTTPGGFGARATTTSAFGGFGSQSVPGSVSGQVQVGTGQPPYQPTREMDPSGTGGTANYISISRMPAYSHKSTEELRYEDYLKRTNPAAAQAAATQNAPTPGMITAGTGAFSGFGAQPSTTSAFGSTPSFGTQSSAFGAPSTGSSGGFNTSAFNSTVTSAPTGGFGGFGSQPAAPATSGGFFGATAQPATSAFGAPATNSAFGAPTTSSAFGSAPGSTSAFGAPASSGGFGSSFGAAAPAQTGGFGGFGNTPAASSGFGNSAFGKPAVSSGFGSFGSTATAAATPAPGGFGFGATQPQAGVNSSFFSGASNAAPASSGFSFGANASKPAATGGFGFGFTGGNTGSAFGASAAPSAFGITPAQPTTGTSSLFGSTTGANGSTSGFNFGNTPSAATGGTTSLFGTNKPASTGIFGSTTAPTGGFFGNTSGTGGSSLFGGANTSNTGATGFGFGTGSSFGSTGTGSFGGFGTTATPATQGGGFGTTSSLFGQSQQPAQPISAPPQNLVAAPDINPYGAGSFGAGLVEQNVKAALDLQSLKLGSNASRLTSFADDVGLPRGPLDPPLTTRRRTLHNRHAIPVSFIRGSFKGSKSRSPTFTFPALTSTSFSALRPETDSNGDSSTKYNDFKFTSSLFRNPMTKKLVIDKGELSSKRDCEPTTRVSIVPISDGDRVDIREIRSSHSQRMKPGDDGKYGISFCNQINKNLFSLRLYPNQTVKQARTEVKQLLRESCGSAVPSIVDIELVLKGKVLHDRSVLEELQLKEGDTIDVIVIEDRVVKDDISKDQHSLLSSLDKTADISSSEEVAPAKRFMTYDEYLAAASRDEADVFKEIESNGASPLSPSCPTLKNKDYYTKPSYERLQAMTDDELSEVEQFTIGCRGLGAVEWIGKTDVRDLDLDELICFERKEVIVYKDEDKKHALGKGLNKPAIVELLGIFPPRKSTSPENYKERVKQRTHDIGATFLDYSVENGIWRFRVEHFSRYGLQDDDADDDVDMSGHDAKLQHISNAPQKPEMTRRPVEIRLNKTSTAERSKLCRQSGIFTNHINSNSVVASFADSQNSFTDNNKLVIRSTALENTESHFECNFEEVSTTKEDQYHTCEVFPVVPYRLKPLDVNSTQKAEDKSPTYQMMVHALKREQNDVVRNHIDGGMLMARSFRCSWGPNGELVNLGKLTTHAENCLSLSNQGQRVCIEFPLRFSETRRSDLQDGLRLHYEFTSQGRDPDIYIERDGYEVPAQYAIQAQGPLMSCLHKYVAHYESRAQKIPSEKHTLLLWKLVQALWGQEYGAQMDDRHDSALCPLASQDCPNELETMKSSQSIEIRREAISQWFESALLVTETGATNNSTASLEGVLNLLCQHRILEASEMAVDCGNIRLATLIAQTASYEGDVFRRLMETQMAQWTENGSLEFMDKTLVLIYSVMAGSVEVLTTHKGASLSWIMCLALFLWYKSGPATSLKSAMTLYKNAVQKQQASSSRSQFAVAGTDKDDILMELLKLYIEDAASLRTVLSPSGFTSQKNGYLDYELTWHLHSVLRAIGYKLDREWESHIHQNFIRQLEGVGLWEDAVYVALNISDVLERESTCRELLFRNADVLDLDVSKRKQLCERLSLPTEWISEALAVRAAAKQERHEEIAHWIAANRYEEAHACLIGHVAMHCLFTNEKDVLLQLLEELEPMAVYISQWKSCETVDTIGGGLLLEYLRLELQKGLKAGHEDQFLQRVLLLSQQLSSAQNASATNTGKKNVLAQTCVSSMVVSLATHAVQLRSLLSYAQERESTTDVSSVTPLELEPEFLNGLSHLVIGRETSFVESYRSNQLMHLCTTFIDWRA
ncbi:nucleoporin 98 [Plasmopara halstedii]|uniref:Nucleoporin 98 n=1 Tax=Plasmopara halstedii TaxID=4781 RepID=A0A0P1APF6_PLAHL|nr:nucleoporin 98 [Plasmopara halstedii]CEG43421.1 nucleoporin 98 [Plasmopara halstedii]|eukprot:XP_024579790.1 nucleoporin 98 [Plasmopara halstedii]